MDIGVIGMGIMGRPMALNLLKAGHAVTVWNRTAQRASPVLDAGAQWADAPADVARADDIVIVCVSDTPDVEAVLFGPHGVAAGLSPGKVVIDMGTTSPRATQNFAARLREQACEMLDAPVSGGDVGAQQGTLAIMVGGAPQVFERCRPVLEALGKTIVHMGENGAGQKTKLVNQILVSSALLGVVEAVRAARADGLDPAKVLDVVSGGAATSWQLTNLGPRMIQGDFAPGFMIRLLDKDLRLAKEWLDALDLDCPGAALTHRLYHEAVERGLGELGTQGLLKMYDREQ